MTILPPKPAAYNNGNLCPQCGADGTVYKTLAPIRYRKCPKCDANWRTQELPSELVDDYVQTARVLQSHLGQIVALAQRLELHAGEAFEIVTLQPDPLLEEHHE